MSSASPAPTPVVETSAPSAVRKQVTALFADLVGSTSFGEQVDGEVARTALADYFELLRSSVEAHAGTTVKFTGDGLMAVFGLPEVAEDDALRAVAAGREMQRRFVSFAQRVQDQFGADLGLRVGINSGELVVGDGDADLVGDVLNTAARLEAACAPGGVLVGEDTWRLTRSAVAYAVADEVRAKGKAEPLATFAVVDAAAVEGDDTPFVGRQVELAALASVLDEVVESGAPRLAVVVGAPGVGKTRLAAEVRSSAPARSFDLRIERRGSTTFSPVADLVRDAAGGTDPDAIAALVADHPDAVRLSSALGSLLGHSAVRSTEEAFWAVRRLVELIAAEHPVVLVVDDIQWAEPLFLDLLEHLAEWAAAPVLLLALARPELREIRPDLTRPGRMVAAAVDLEGLDASTTLELARALLDGHALPQDLVDQLPESTEGNPLFVRELVRMLVEDGVLERSDVGWQLTVDVEAIDVPPTVLSLLASRVERLPDDEREVLELASVVGTDFDRGSLAALASPAVGGVIGALLDRLRRKDLVHPSGAWVGDEPVFRFHHVLLRDAAYRRLLKARRAELHERLAGHVVETGTEGAADETDVVAALHYERAHRFRTELGESGPDVEALALHAVERLLRATEQALDRDDLPAAAGYAVRALDLDVDGSHRDELLLVGCEALLSLGDAVGAADHVEELSRRHTDDRLAAWADCFRAQQWTLTDPDRLEEAASSTDAAASKLAEFGDQAGVAKAHLVRASALVRLGRVGDCEHELDQALTAARVAGDRRRIVAVLGNTPLAALWGPSPAARAGGRCLDVLRLLHITTASPGVEATSYRCQGVLEALRGRFDSARAKLETSLATSRELGLRQGVMETELFTGMVELLAGESAAAEEHLRSAAAGLGHLGIGADAGRARALLALAVLEGGDVDEAEGLAETARESAGQNLQTTIASAVALAQVRSIQGRHDEAEVLVAEAIERAAPTDAVLDHAFALAAGARVALAGGDTETARVRRSEAVSLVEAKGSHHWIGVSLDDAEIRPVESAADESADSAPSFGDEDLWTSILGTIAAAWEPFDEATMSAVLTDGFVWIDHQPASTGRLDAQGFLAYAGGHPSGETLEILEVLGQSEAVVAFQFRSLDETGFERRTLIVMEREGHCLRRIEVMAPEQRELAMMRFDELRRGIDVVEPNAAFDVALRSLSAIRSGDAAAARDVFADDFIGRWHGGDVLQEGEAGPDEAAAVAEMFRDDQIAGADLEVVATRGDDLCLHRASVATGGVVVRWFSVCRQRGGRLISTTNFSAYSLSDAFAELERLAIESGLWDEWADSAGVIFRATGIDRDLARAVLRDDFVLVDHRSVTLGRLSADDYADLVSVDIPGREGRCLEVVRMSAHVMILHLDLDDAGGRTWRFFDVVAQGDDHLIHRIETFDPGQRADAIARFEELSAGETVRSEPATVSPNMAFEALERIVASWADGDFEAARREMGAGQLESRSPVDDGEVTVEGFVQQMRFLYESPGFWVETPELVATRGDRLAIARLRQGFDGETVERLIVGECVEAGSPLVTIFYDPSDLRDAMMELDRRDDVLLGLGDDGWLPLGEALTESFQTLDAQRVRSCLADDFRWEDRRPLSMGSVGPDDFVEFQIERGASEGWFLEVFEKTRHCMVGLTSINSWNDGSEWRLVQLWERKGGLVRRMYTFDVDQRDDAIELFHELDRQHAEETPNVLSNRAIERWRERIEATVRGDPIEERLKAVDPDFTWEERFRERDAMPVKVDAADSAAMNDTVRGASAESFRIDIEPLATRGDDLALGRGRQVIDGSAMGDALVVVEVGDSGLLKAITMFDEDDLVGAFEFLDARWLDHGGPADWVHRGRGADAWHEDGLLIDHRALGLGTLTGPEHTAASEARAPGLQIEAIEVGDVRGDLMMLRLEAWTEDGSGWRAWSVIKMEDSKHRSVDLFEDDDLAGARRRFDELVSAGQVIAEPTNRAIELFREGAVSFLDGTIAMAEWAERDYEFRNRGTLDVDLHGAESDAQWRFVFEHLVSVEIEGVAVRGDDLALMRTFEEWGGGGSGESLFVIELGPTGKVKSHTLYEAHQLADALDELDRRWRSSAPSTADWAELSIEDRARLTEGRDGWTCCTPDAEWIDHRLLGFGRLTGEEFGRMRNSVAGYVNYLVDFDRLASDLALVRMRAETADSSAWEVWSLMQRSGIDLVRVEVFDLDDLDAARARFDELVDAGR